MRGHYRSYFIHQKHKLLHTQTDAIFIDYGDETCRTVVGPVSVAISRQDAARALRKARNSTGEDYTFTVKREHYVKYCQKCQRT